MCGLAGMVASRGGAPPRRDRIEAAVRALRHRGPDGSGTHVTDAVGLAHTRLSIVDLDGGAQPIPTDDGSVVTVYNGEIWNFPELRDELERAGHRVPDAVDTEVLVHGYEEWGDGLPRASTGCSRSRSGIERRERLLLARDRVGKKPLYYRRRPHGSPLDRPSARFIIVRAAAGRARRGEGRRVPLSTLRLARLTTFFAASRSCRRVICSSTTATASVRRAYWASVFRADEPLEPAACARSSAIAAEDA